jgi:drug/metabolite transporter (DMT)-like permease
VKARDEERTSADGYARGLPPETTIHAAGLGLLAATSAAALWAMATVLYGRAGRVIPPVRLNAIKGVFVCGLFTLTLLVLGTDFVGDLRQTPTRVLVLLALSGVVGISLGDSFYFAGVNRLGARRTTLLSLTATPMVVLGDVAVLGERLPWLAWVGIAVTLVGVVWVVLERTPADEAGDRRHAMAGIGFGLLAAIGQAGGALLNKAALDASSLDPLTTALWRLGTATLVLLPFAFRGGVGKATAATWGIVAAAALIGTYGGIWLQQTAFDAAPAGPVQTLLSTTPIFVLPLAAWAGERVSLRAVIGAVMTVLGVGVLVYAVGA